jgi:hypothetical protein
MARLLAHLAGPPHHRSPLIFPTCPNSCALLKSIDVGVWSTSLTRGERPVWRDLKRVKESNTHISGVVNELPTL